MPTEKERLLAVATPEGWDCFLSAFGYEISYERCLFCEAVGVEKYKTGYGNRNDCGLCMPDQFDIDSSLPCVAIPFTGKVDAAIARLERAGIWED